MYKIINKLNNYKEQLKDFEFLNVYNLNSEILAFISENEILLNIFNEQINHFNCYQLNNKYNEQEQSIKNYLFKEIEINKKYFLDEESARKEIALIKTLINQENGIEIFMSWLMQEYTNLSNIYSIIYYNSEPIFTILLNDINKDIPITERIRVQEYPHFEISYYYAYMDKIVKLNISKNDEFNNMVKANEVTCIYNANWEKLQLYYAIFMVLNDLNEVIVQPNIELSKIKNEEYIIKNTIDNEVDENKSNNTYLQVKNLFGDKTDEFLWIIKHISLKNEEICNLYTKKYNYPITVSNLNNNKITVIRNILGADNKASIYPIFIKKYGSDILDNIHE